jgi:hypothetical protein
MTPHRWAKDDKRLTSRHHDPEASREGRAILSISIQESKNNPRRGSWWLREKI